MNDLTQTITQQFEASWPALIAQLLFITIIVGLFVAAARLILTRGRGWEVPIWLLLSFLIPIVFPILAIIRFRRLKRQVNGLGSKDSPSLASAQ